MFTSIYHHVFGHYPSSRSLERRGGEDEAQGGLDNMHTQFVTEVERARSDFDPDEIVHATDSAIYDHRRERKKLVEPAALLSDGHLGSSSALLSNAKVGNSEKSKERQRTASVARSLRESETSLSNDELLRLIQANKAQLCPTVMHEQHFEACESIKHVNAELRERERQLFGLTGKTYQDLVEQSIDNLSFEGKLAFQKAAQTSARLAFNWQPDLGDELKERKQELLELTGSTYEKLVDQNLSHLSLKENHALRRIIETRARLEALLDVELDWEEQSFQSKLEGEYRKRLSQSKESPTAAAAAVRALLTAQGILITPKTPPISPVSNNVFVQAKQAEQAARAAFKESKTVFEVVTGSSYARVLAMGIEILQSKRHQELFIIAANAEAELKQAEKYQADLMKAETWIERYGEETEALRERSRAPREASKLVRSTQSSYVLQRKASSSVRVAMESSKNVFETQNMLDRAEEEG